MSRLRPTHWREVERVILKLGYHQHRTRGSHGVYVKSGVLMHVTLKLQGDIPVGTLNSIIKQLGESREHFLELLDNSRN